MALIKTERPAQRTAVRNTALRDWVRALEATAPIAANPHRLLPDVIRELAEAHGDAPALLSAGESLTYRTLANRSNRYARWALDAGVAPGETVALMMPNRPEYLAIWLGLSSVGVVVALLNTQLRGPSLGHCVSIAAPTTPSSLQSSARNSPLRQRNRQSNRKSGPTAAAPEPKDSRG